MKKFLLSASLLLIANSLWAARGPEVQKAAPEFSAPASDGKTYKLSDFKGQYVVLEWWNKDCPFVKKHYGSGNMQALQKEFTGKKVAWLTILSSAPGKQGFLSAAEASKSMSEVNAAPTAVLLDPAGEIGKLYEAKTTPHMFVIDPKGVLIYMGAIDSKRGTEPSEIKDATNYVRQALESAQAGKPVLTATSSPYGCSVKYK